MSAFSSNALRRCCPNGRFLPIDLAAGQSRGLFFSIRSKKSVRLFRRLRRPEGGWRGTGQLRDEAMQIAPDTVEPVCARNAFFIKVERTVDFDLKHMNPIDGAAIG